MAPLRIVELDDNGKIVINKVNLTRLTDGILKDPNLEIVPLSVSASSTATSTLITNILINVFKSKGRTWKKSLEEGITIGFPMKLEQFTINSRTASSSVKQNCRVKTAAKEVTTGEKCSKNPQSSRKMTATKETDSKQTNIHDYKKNVVTNEREKVIEVCKSVINLSPNTVATDHEAAQALENLKKAAETFTVLVEKANDQHTQQTMPIKTKEDKTDKPPESKPSTSLNEVGNNQEITMASRQETTDKHSGKQSNKTNKPDNSPRYTDEDVLSGTNESSLDSKLFSTSKVESNNIPLIGDKEQSKTVSVVVSTKTKKSADSLCQEEDMKSTNNVSNDNSKTGTNVIKSSNKRKQKFESEAVNLQKGNVNPNSATGKSKGELIAEGVCEIHTNPVDSSEKTPSGPISGVYVWPELLPVEDATQKKLCLFLHAVPDRNPGPSSMDLVLVLLSSVFVNIREDDKSIFEDSRRHYNIQTSENILVDLLANEFADYTLVPKNDHLGLSLSTPQANGILKLSTSLKKRIVCETETFKNRQDVNFSQFVASQVYSANECLKSTGRSVAPNVLGPGAFKITSVREGVGNKPRLSVTSPIAPPQKCTAQKLPQKVDGSGVAIAKEKLSTSLPSSGTPSTNLAANKDLPMNFVSNRAPASPDFEAAVHERLEFVLNDLVDNRLPFLVSRSFVLNDTECSKLVHAVISSYLKANDKYQSVDANRDAVILTKNVKEFLGTASRLFAQYEQWVNQNTTALFDKGISKVTDTVDVFLKVINLKSPYSKYLRQVLCKVASGKTIQNPVPKIGEIPISSRSLNEEVFQFYNNYLDTIRSKKSYIQPQVLYGIHLSLRAKIQSYIMRSGGNASIVANLDDVFSAKFRENSAKLEIIQKSVLTMIKTEMNSFETKVKELKDTSPSNVAQKVEIIKADAVKALCNKVKKDISPDEPTSNYVIRLMAKMNKHLEACGIKFERRVKVDANIKRTPNTVSLNVPNVPQPKLGNPASQASASTEGFFLKIGLAKTTAYHPGEMATQDFQNVVGINSLGEWIFFKDDEHFKIEKDKLLVLEDMWMQDQQLHTVKIEHILSNLFSFIAVAIKLATTEAYVCVPCWFSSLQRQQILQGLRLAGFQNCRILNENTASAFRFFSLEHKKDTEFVVVISEASNQTDVSLFKCSDNPLNTTLVAHKGDYSESKPTIFEKVGSLWSSLTGSKRQETLDQLAALWQDVARRANMSMNKTKIEVIISCDSEEKRRLLVCLGERINGKTASVRNDYSLLGLHAFWERMKKTEHLMNNKFPEVLVRSVLTRVGLNEVKHTNDSKSTNLDCQTLSEIEIHPKCVVEILEPVGKIKHSIGFIQLKECPSSYASISLQSDINGIFKCHQVDFLKKGYMGSYSLCKRGNMATDYEWKPVILL